MPQLHAPTFPIAEMLRAVGRFFGGGRPDPLEVRLARAADAGTPPTADETADLAAARAEIRRGEFTMDPLGPEH